MCQASLFDGASATPHIEPTIAELPPISLSLLFDNATAPFPVEPITVVLPQILFLLNVSLDKSRCRATASRRDKISCRNLSRLNQEIKPCRSSSRAKPSASNSQGSLKFAPDNCN